jgi:hypothetical protein
MTIYDDLNAARKRAIKRASEARKQRERAELWKHRAEEWRELAESRERTLRLVAAELADRGPQT